MKSIFLFLVLIMIICLTDTLSAQFSMRIRRWTPVKSKADVLFSYLTFDGKKSKSTFNIRSSLLKDLTVVYVKDTLADGTIATKPSYYDVNGDSLRLVGIIRRMGLTRLPSDPSKIMVKKLGSDTISNWIFIEGASAVLWLSPLVKKSKSYYITGEAKIYFLPRPLRLDSISAQSLDAGLIFMNGSRVDILSNSGDRLDVSSLGKEVIVMNRRMLPIVTDRGTSWLDLGSEGAVQFGRLISDVFAKNNIDSLAKIFFDGTTLRAIWPNGNFSHYNFARDKNHQIDLIDTSFGNALAKAVMDFGKIVAIIFADTNNQMIVPAPDSVYSFAGNQNLLYNAASNFDGVLAIIDSVGNFRAFPPDSFGKIRDIKVSNLQQLAALNTNRNIEINLKDSVSLAVFISESKQGKIDSGLVLPSYKMLVSYLGTPAYVENGEFIFIKGPDLNRLLTDSLITRIYHLGSRFGGKDISSFHLKKIGSLKVAELSFSDDNQKGRDAAFQWFWPESGRLTEDLGSFVGLAEYDSSIYTFIRPDALFFLSTNEWWWSHSDLKVFSLPREYPVDSNNYSVMVYADSKPIIVKDTVEGEEFIYNEPDVYARVVCISKKKETDPFPFDQRLHIGLVFKSPVRRKEW